MVRWKTRKRTVDGGKQRRAGRDGGGLELEHLVEEFTLREWVTWWLHAVRRT